VSFGWTVDPGAGGVEALLPNGVSHTTTLELSRPLRCGEGFSTRPFTSSVLAVTGAICALADLELQHRKTATRMKWYAGICRVKK
jgi:hypothetical protein